MRTLAVMAAALGLVGTIAVGTAPPAAADWYSLAFRGPPQLGGLFLLQAA